MQYGYQCGMIWGAALAAGAQAYQLFGPGPKAEVMAVIAAQRLVKSFRSLNNEIDCAEITNLDRSSSAMWMIFHFLLKGGSISCFHRAFRYAKEALGEIDNSLSQDHLILPQPPVSCTAILAKKVGASDIQTVMVAGLAGGIGLSGSACGALGTAIWLIGINTLKEEGDKLAFKSPRAEDTIERFLKCSDYEFECSTIVGNTFGNVSDHAEHIHNQGCSKIIETLAGA
jgi:hypothetical protein